MRGTSFAIGCQANIHGLTCDFAFACAVFSGESRYLFFANGAETGRRRFRRRAGRRELFGRIASRPGLSRPMALSVECLKRALAVPRVKRSQPGTLSWTTPVDVWEGRDHWYSHEALEVRIIHHLKLLCPEFTEVGSMMGFGRGSRRTALVPLARVE